MKKPISEKHRIFCHGILLGKGKKKSAVAAGYSPKSAQSLASQILAREDVREYLLAQCQRQEYEVALDREILRKKLMGIATAHAPDAFDETWQLLDKSAMPKNVAKLLIGVKVWEGEQGRSVSAKLVHPLDPIKLYFKLFPEAEKKAEDLSEAAEQVQTSWEDLIRRLES